MPEYVDFRASCGHLVRVNNPKSVEWDKLVCLASVDGNYCGKPVNRRETVKPVETKDLTEEDIQLLKNMKISL